VRRRTVLCIAIPFLMSQPGSSAPGGPVRLNGWKDIASHLERGVRTVQRWEKDYGLPVRRLGPGRGEGVFAFVQEIDEWQSSAQAARARWETSSASTDSSPDAAPPAGPDSAGGAAGTDGHRERADAGDSLAGNPRHTRSLIVVLVVAVVATAVWASWTTWRAYGPTNLAGEQTPAAGRPAAWRVEADSLVALDAEKRVCWTYRVPTVLNPAFYATQVPGALGGVGDIDDDGRREIWIVAVPMIPDSREFKLHVFDEDGTPRFAYQHEGSVVFGATTFSGPWPVYRTFLTEAPEDPRHHALWVASRDGSEFPSLLVRLDVHSGKILSGPYWNDGWIDSAALLRSPAGPRLLIGVTNNEKQAPGVVVLDAANITGSAPAEAAKYRCTTCPAGEPLGVAAFPKPRRFAPAAGSGGVDSVAVSVSASGPAAPVEVTATYAISRSGGAASAVFHLGTDLTPLQADPGDNYIPTYEQLVREGSVPAFGPLPAEPSSELLPILRWDRTARRYVPVRFDHRSR
jgi:hypothetical protein